MRTTFKPVVTVMSVATALSMTLAACQTEADEVAEVPIDEATVVDADAPAVGVPNPQGDADPVTARPDDAANDGDRTPGEPGQPIDDHDRVPAVQATE